MASIKIFYGSEVRRVSTKHAPTWEQFQKLLASLFGSKYHSGLQVQYVDQEGDTVTVTCQLEWEEAVAQHKDLIRLQLVEAKLSGSAEIPRRNTEAETDSTISAELKPLFFYKENNEPIEDSATDLAKFIPNCLKHYLEGESFLPENIPDWLQPAVRVTTVPSKCEIDLDVDIGKLFYALFDYGLELLKTRRYEEGRRAFQNALVIKPMHEIALYNLACAHSLLNQTQDAFDCLRKAIESNYHNFEHLNTDPDLENVRNHPDFHKLFPAKETGQDPEESMSTPPEPSHETQTATHGDSQVQNDNSTEPAPLTAEPAAPFKYENELQAILAMGFTQKERVAQLLLDHKGDANKVTQVLLDD